MVTAKAKDIRVDERPDEYHSNEEDGSDYTSITSEYLKGYIENGRRYQSLRDADHWAPSDDQQFQSMEVCHALYLVLHSQQPEPLFFSPIGTRPKHILDIGTGKGNWAIDVADKYPRATVYGVDLYPPPSRWIPPNVHLDVDDVLQPWTFAHKFSFIHLRHLHGSFSRDEWKLLYQRCFDALEPGGWIEQAECSHVIHSSDGTVKSDSVLAQCSSLLSACGERSLRPIDIAATMASSIKTAGFDNVQEREWQIPIGAWPKDRFLKEIGRINKAYWDQGLEGWALRLLTKYGEPQPWSADEVRTYVGKIKDELKNRKTHPWHLTRRVWAQKPNNV